MRIARAPRFLLFGVLAFVPATADSKEKQAAKTTEAPPTPRESQKAPAVDPNAIAALEKMGAFLRDQKSLSVRVVTNTDEILDTGQKVQLAGVTDIYVKRPDRLRAIVKADRKERQFFYDGKTFSLYGPKNGYYATVPAPPKLGQLADVVSDKYGVELPMADLFYWGTDKSGVENITSAINLGPSRIEGVETDHFAFRQPDLDWQIWIERGSEPLPKKLVLTTTAEKSQPQHEAVMRWDLKPKLSDKDFTFVPPKGAQRIEFLDVASKVQNENKNK